MPPFLGCRHTLVPRKIELFCSFPGIRTRLRVGRRTWRHRPLLWSCNSRRSPRNTRGWHRPVYPLVSTHRRHGRLTEWPGRIDSVNSRIAPLYQALFSHKALGACPNPATVPLK